MGYPCLLKSVVASDRSDLELGDAVVLQHSSHFCFHLRGQLLYTHIQQLVRQNTGLGIGSMLLVLALMTRRLHR